MRGFFELVGDHLAEGQRVFAAIVMAHTPHSPGTEGARMAVFEDGSSIGTIGGGAMERDVQALATRALSAAAFRARVQVLVHRPDHADASGLVCAGEQRNLYLVLTPDDHGVIEACASSLWEDTAGELVIGPDGVSFEAPVGAGPRYSFSERESGWVFREQLLNPDRVAILGGGHCALALTRALKELDYFVTVIDDRKGLSTLEANRVADRCLVVGDMATAADRISHPEQTSVVCMGTDLQTDVRSLIGALSRPFPFIGLMGAPAKISRIRQELVALGVDPDALGRITAPVGLDIGSRTPEEIAVSVAAQLVARRRNA